LNEFNNNSEENKFKIQNSKFKIQNSKFKIKKPIFWFYGLCFFFAMVQ